MVLYYKNNKYKNKFLAKNCNKSTPVIIPVFFYRKNIMHGK